MALPRFVPILCSGLLAPLTSYAADVAPLAPATSPPWTYDGDGNGQDEWAELAPAYATCEIGTSQSPVVISDPSIAPLPKLDFRYAESAFSFSHGPLHFSAEPKSEQELKVGGKRYTLYRIDLHSPSEHTIRDVFYPLEMHLWHHDSDNHTLVVSVFASYGDSANPALDAMANAAKASAQTGALRFNPAALLPKNLGYYAYTGSQTTPPCTEGVEWRVLKESILMTKPQMKALSQFIMRNARLTQPLYLRKILEHSE